MDTGKTYNGWTNYETWAVKLWLDNEYGSYTEMTGKAEELYADRDTSEYDQDKTRGHYSAADLAMADYVETAIKDANPLAGSASVFADLMNAALSEVNWREIGEAYINDAAENAPA